jgi:transcriptional regulator with XRE-family HTH domain
MNALIERIVKLRKHKGFSQKYMAERLGIAVINYGKYERGETSLTIDRLYQICEILDVNINYLFIEQIDDNTFKMLDDKTELLKNNLEQYQTKQEYWDLKDKLTDFKIAINHLTYHLALSVVGGLPFKDPYRLFSSYLNQYLNGRDNIEKGYGWFMEFISIYNIEALKNLYSEFFELAMFEDNYKTLDKLINRYELEKKDQKLSRFVSDWYSFFYSSLYNELFGNSMVFSFLRSNEKEFELIASKDVFEYWLEYKKSKEQG